MSAFDLIALGIVLLAIALFGIGAFYEWRLSRRHIAREPVQPYWGDHPLRSWERRREP